MLVDTCLKKTTCWHCFFFFFAKITIEVAYNNSLKTKHRLKSTINIFYVGEAG